MKFKLPVVVIAGVLVTCILFYYSSYNFSNLQEKSVMFNDRSDAGKQLAVQLKQKGLMSDALIVALPRGGVPVGYEIARELQAPLTTFIVRKLGAPHNPEFAIGALAQTGSYILDADLVKSLSISSKDLEALKEKEQNEAIRRQRVYQKEGLPPIKGKTVIVVDDGIATGSTMLVALKALKELKPKRLIVAAPVSAPDSLEKLRTYADEIVVLSAPPSFGAVGSFYVHFPQVEDDEVISLLNEAARIQKNK